MELPLFRLQFRQTDRERERYDLYQTKTLKMITFSFIKILQIFQSFISRLGNSSFADFIWCCSWKNNTSSTSNNGSHRNSSVHLQ